MRHTFLTCSDRYLGWHKRDRHNCTGSASSNDTSANYASSNTSSSYPTSPNTRFFGEFDLQHTVKN